MDRINLGPAKPKKWWVGENSPQEGAATPVTLDPGPWASRLVFLGCLGWILVTPVSCNSCLLGIPSCLHFIRTFTTLVKNNYLNSFFSAQRRARIMSHLSSAIPQGLTQRLENE